MGGGQSCPGCLCTGPKFASSRGSPERVVLSSHHGHDHGMSSDPALPQALMENQQGYFTLLGFLGGVTNRAKHRGLQLN